MTNKTTVELLLRRLASDKKAPASVRLDAIRLLCVLERGLSLAETGVKPEKSSGSLAHLIGANSAQTASASAGQTNQSAEKSAQTAGQSATIRNGIES
jgi:hypothetical protein